MYDQEINLRSLPCEDDCECTAPYIGMLPDESEGEDVSPLDFSSRGRMFRIGDCEEPDEVPEDYSGYYEYLAITKKPVRHRTIG